MAMTSSSALSQPLSDSPDTPSGFEEEAENENDAETEEETDNESRGSEPPLRLYTRPLKIQLSSRRARTVKTLPFELQEQSRILFEETLYTQALRLVQTLLTAGYSNTSLKEWRPAFVAPPAQLALIATLAVHPSLNTKTRNRQKLTASVDAIRYLRLVQALAGPLDGNLSKAYRFPDRANSTRRGIFIRRRSRSPDAEITLPLASSDSLWKQGRDFWAVAGWAFNCSVRIRKRWDVWEPWLEHVLSVLNEDWLLHCESPANSLVANYLHDHDGRRVMRAVFADGGKHSLQEFPEVWKNEAAEPKAKRRAHEKVEVNFELDEFGDYMKDSSEEDEVDKINKIFEDGTAPPDAHLEDGPSMGGEGSIELRMRFFALLLEITQLYPEGFVRRDTVIEMFVTVTRHLPVATVKSVLSLFDFDYFSFSHASFLIQSLACSFLESAAPQRPTEQLSQEILKQHYLPWTANTTSAADNAKLSICIEALVRLYMAAHKRETWTEEVLTKFEEGIDNRDKKVHGGYEKKLGTTSQQLEDSEDRLRFLADVGS